MDWSLVFTAIIAVFRAPEEMRKLLLWLEKSDAEKRQDVMKRVEADNEQFIKTGRPSWQ